MPSFDELPELPLCCEQVIAYVESILSPLNQGIDGSWSTSSMINNYVKTGLLAPPVKKMYTRENIGRLLVICAFKQVLSKKLGPAPFTEVRPHLIDIEAVSNRLAKRC